MKPFKFHTLIAALVMAAVTVLFDLSVQAGDLLVCSSGNASVKRYDQTTGTFVGDFATGVPGPHGLTYGPDGNLYVTSSSGSTGSVERFNGTTGAFINTFVPIASGGLTAPRGLVFGPDGNLYVASSLDGSVKRYDGTTGGFMGDFVPSGSGGLSGSTGLTFGPDGNLYVASAGGSTRSVKRYNGMTGAYLGDFVPSGSGGLLSPQGLTFGPDGNLYVTSYAPGPTSSVKRYSGVTGAFMGDFVTPGSGGLNEPLDLKFGPDGNLYVDNGNAGNPNVLRYNGTTGAFIDVFVTPGSGGLLEPRGMVFMPSPPPPPTAFRDDFSTPTLDPAWRIRSGIGAYSLTANPGHLRYSLATTTFPGDANALWLYRQFAGDRWVFETQVSYSMPVGLGRQLHARILFGGLEQKGINQAEWTRDRDDGGGAPRNRVWGSFVDGGVSGGVPGSGFGGDPTLGFALPTNAADTYFVRITRIGQQVTIEQSPDGATFTTVVQRTFTTVLGSTQTVLISGANFAGSGYADYDYVEVRALPTNNPPVADAGPDQTVMTANPAGANVTLDGSGSSDPDGDTLTYTWSENNQIIATGAQPSVLLSPGVHTITLTVDDGKGSTDSDTVVVEVILNLPPVANASLTPTEVISPNNFNALVTLDGSLSFDPEGVPLDYFWYVNGNLVGMDAVMTVVLPVGTYSVTLFVDDGFSTDSVTVIVRVVTAGQATNTLIAQVNAANIPPGTQNDLNASLLVAAASFNRGNTNAGVNQLRAFQNKVAAQAGKKIDPVTAAVLIAAAQRIIDAVTGR